MPDYPLNAGSAYHSPAGWTNSIASPSSPAGGNGPGNSQPYSRRDSEAEFWFWGAVYGAEHFADAAYHEGVKIVHDVEDTTIRLSHVAGALYLANDYAAGAIEAKIRMDVEELKKAFIPGLLMSLGILAVTTFIGAAGAGILAGILSGGAAAVPAAIAGGEFGLDAGFLVLDAMGIGFLLKDIFAGIPKIFDLVQTSVGIAWNAGSIPTRPAITDVEKAAHGLAKAAAELVNLVVEGVLVWVLSKSAVAKGGKLAKGAGNLNDPAVLAARGREIIQELRAKPGEMQAALAAGTAELSSMLRKAGSLTRGLADFVEKKINQILENVTEDAGKKVDISKGDGGAPDVEVKPAASSGPRGKAAAKTKVVAPPEAEPKPAGAPPRDRALLTEADPARQVMGPATATHPAEIAKMRKALTDAGVEVIERPGSMAYAPGLSKGAPGQMIIDPEASYSAWLHEFQHAMDDQAIGWGGMKSLFDNDLRWQWEQNAYQQEIDYASKLGHDDVVDQLMKNMENERQSIFGPPPD